MGLDLITTKIDRQAAMFARAENHPPGPRQLRRHGVMVRPASRSWTLRDIRDTMDNPFREVLSP
jgi:hypothetical protein